MTDATGILEGIRVVEAASMVFVPCAGVVMADYGAWANSTMISGTAGGNRT